MILSTLYNPRLNLIICGDININYLNDSDRKSHLDALLNSYNLFSTVNFPTRMNNDCSSAIDNVFFDISKMGDYEIIPLINGLSDHDGQLIILNNIKNKPYEHRSYFTRKINRYTIADFQIKLSYETWDSVFNGEDVTVIFNSFLNTYLRIFYSSFPLTKI
jgi:hypothetical protein